MEKFDLNTKCHKESKGVRNSNEEVQSGMKWHECSDAFVFYAF